MNVVSYEQPLQLLSLFLALIEFILALYVLALNVWHMANRHVSGLVLLFSLNSLGVGLMAAASNAAQATVPSYLLAATIPVLQLAVLITLANLFKPTWFQGRWRWIWWVLYGVILLPGVLTCVDAALGTQLYYTGLDPQIYSGGLGGLAQYAQGGLASVLMPLTYLPTFPILLFLLYVGLLDKKAAVLNRRLAWMLLLIHVVAAVVVILFQNMPGILLSTAVANIIVVSAYAYALLRQMLAGYHLQRGKLSLRLTAIVLVIAIPILVGVVALFVSRSRSELLGSVTRRLGTTNQSLATTASRWVDTNVYMLQRFVAQPDIVSMDAQRQKPALDVMEAVHPHMYLVSTTDLSGLNVARSDDQAAKDYGDRAWFREARSGQAVSFQSLIGRTSGGPAVVVSVPIQDDAGQIVGVGMFASDLTQLAEEVLTIKVGESGLAYVVDGEGMVLAHTDPAFSETLVDYSQYPPVVLLQAGSRGEVIFEDQAGQRWRAYVGQLDNGWGVVVQQPEDEVLAPLRGFQIGVWSTLVASVLVLAALTALALRWSLSPIDALTETASSIAAGDLEQTAPVKSEDELGTLARTINGMTDQLRGLIDTLESRVADRTHDLERRSRYLEATAEIARGAASVLDPQELLSQVVTLISDQFGFYQVGIFLLDASGEWMELRAASSPGGKRMLERGHRLRVGQEGVVGYVVARGEPHIALDVGDDAVYFDNPDLPETRSEVALPLRARGEILGALDVQSKEPQAFSDEEVSVLQTMADQVAIAISNARLFQQVEDALESMRQAYGEMSLKAWAERLSRQAAMGYYCDADGVVPVSEQRQQDDQNLPALDIPIIIHDQVIGSLSAHKPEDGDEWAYEEVRLMESLVDQLGVALESARLYQDSQRRAAREQVASEVAARIRGTLDMETILRTAVQEVRQTLNLPEVIIKLVGPRQDAGGE